MNGPSSTPPRSGGSGRSAQRRTSASPVRRDIQKSVMLMIVAIMALDAVATVLYNRHGMELRDGRMRLAVAGLWMLATLAVLWPFLTKIRRLRAEGRGIAHR